MSPATQLWACLSQVRSLRFVARSGVPTGWNGVGAGTVVVAAPAEAVLTFDEAGLWQPTVGAAARFTNVYRWTRLGEHFVRLEHLRFGPDRPVHLFDLGSATGDIWTPVRQHVCRDDCYSAVLKVRDQGLRLQWSITGPRKQETVEYDYRWSDRGV